MKYETRNNIGVLLATLGTIIIIADFVLFGLATPYFIIFILLGIILFGIGIYMITRGFTEHDKDHPDYNRYLEMQEERKKFKK